MTMTDALTRISQIQATLAQLSVPLTTPTSAATTRASFAQVLKSSASASATTLGVSTAPESDTASVPSSAPVSVPVPSGSVTGADVVAEAKTYLGVPYVFGGESRRGIDCSGLVQKVYGDLGISLPRVVPDQAKMGTAVKSLADARPGDLIVSQGGGHIAIWMGDNKLLYAPAPGRSVLINNNYLKDSDIVTIRRIIPDRTVASQSQLSAAAQQKLFVGTH